MGQSFVNDRFLLELGGGRLEFGRVPSFSGFAIGIMVACFLSDGNLLVSHILLKSCVRLLRMLSGSRLSNWYGILSCRGPDFFVLMCV